jgi:hypothetical protein
MLEWNEQIFIGDTNNEFIDGLTDIKDSVFIGVGIPIEETLTPIYYNREDAVNLLMSLDVGPMESVTIVGNSRVWGKVYPREIVDWLREGF